jgi:glutathione S-transferase
VRTPELMRGAAAEVAQGAIADLDGRLADGREWAAGDAFTLADVSSGPPRSGG